MRARELFAVGTSHAAAPVSLREAVAMSDRRARRFLAELETVLPSVHEAAILSTCTRTEIYLVAPGRDAAEKVRARLAGRAGEGTCRPERHIYLLEGEAAARHVFRVAGGLDSIILGEGQILGQVKEARRRAWSEGTCGTILCQLLDDAVRCGKRIRTETDLSRGSVSIASAAAAIVVRDLGDLTDRTVLVLGAGETGALAARMLAKSRPGSLLVVNRTRRAAEALAREVGGEAVAMKGLSSALARCDAAICATASAEPVLTLDLVRRVQHGRAGRALRLVDVANPRDVEPEVAEVEGVSLLDLDDMRLRVEDSLDQREKEVPKAEAIVDDELRRFVDWLETRDVVPLLRALRRSFREIGEDVLEAEIRRHGEEHREPLARAMRRLLNTLLHTPTVRLKSLDPSTHTDLLKLRAIEDLFALGVPGDHEPVSPEASDDGGTGRRTITQRARDAVGP
ncbi:MAG: glutamyl-tRNA reductase [Gemmatimonadota bacterium]